MDENKIEVVEETAEEVAEEVVEAVEEEKTPEQIAREEEAIAKAKKAKIKAIWDKVTTGLLIAVMASPFFILLWILLWFINPM